MIANASIPKYFVQIPDRKDVIPNPANNTTPVFPTVILSQPGNPPKLSNPLTFTDFELVKEQKSIRLEGQSDADSYPKIGEKYEFQYFNAVYHLTSACWSLTLLWFSWIPLC
eukprot:454417_1